jgi:predicted N-acetyltransferase YhbS
MTKLLSLSQIDPARVEALLDEAFGEDRFGRTAYKLRAGTEAIEELSFAALDGDELVGSIQCWPVALETEQGKREPLTLVGPVAVSPSVQKGGIGKLLMTRMLVAAQEHRHDALMMIGDPEYYERFFGFSAASTSEWQLPGPVERHRLLARISRPGGVSLAGRIIPNPAFATGPVSA